MKKAFIESVMKVLGIPKIEPHKLAFKEVLDGRDLEKDVQELNQTLIAITKTVRTVYLRKKTKG